MPEFFIVTVMNASGGFEVDLEIPSWVPIAELRANLLKILKILDPGEFQGWSGCRVQHRDRFLADGDTLADAGAFDGSRIVLVKPD